MKHVSLAVFLLVGCGGGEEMAAEPSAGDEAAAASPSRTQPAAGSTSSPTTWGSAGASAPAAGASVTTSMQPSAAGAAAPGSAAPGSAGPSSSSSCDALGACCGALVDPTLRGTCESVAKSRAEAACAGVTGMLCSSSTTTAATPPQAGCAALEACCVTLDEEDAEDCQGVVDEADPLACGDTLAELCPDPNAPPPPEDD
jgi:hypothetical protein